MMLGISIIIWWTLIFVFFVILISLLFAVLGLKNKLDKIIENTGKTNEHLSMLHLGRALPSAIRGKKINVMEEAKCDICGNRDTKQKIGKHYVCNNCDATRLNS